MAKPLSEVSSRVARASVVLALVLTLAGCGGASGPGGAGADRDFDLRKSYQAARRLGSHATTADVLRYGYLDDVRFDGAGHVLRTFVLTNDDDEGPYAVAWRLSADLTSDADLGKGMLLRADESPAESTIWTLQAGFLVRPVGTASRLVRIGADGRLAPVRRGPGVAATRPGDLLVPPNDTSVPTLVYRPADGTAHPLPGRGPSAVDRYPPVIDANGVVWTIPPTTGRPVLAGSRDGHHWTLRGPAGPAGSWAGPRTAIGPRVYVPFLDRGDGEVRVRSLVVRSGTVRPPQRLDVAGLPKLYQPGVVGAVDGRAVLGSSGPDWYAVGGGAAPTRIDLPGSGEWDLHVDGDRLVAVDWSESRAAYSTDVGRTWQAIGR